MTWKLLQRNELTHCNTLNPMWKCKIFSKNHFYNAAHILRVIVSTLTTAALQQMGGTLVILPTWSLKIFEMTTGTLCSAPPWNTWRAVKEIHFYISHPSDTNTVQKYKYIASSKIIVSKTNETWYILKSCSSLISKRLILCNDYLACGDMSALPEHV